jgi:hypothetical protein
VERVAGERRIIQIMPAPGWYAVLFNFLGAAHQGEQITLSLEQLIGWALVEIGDAGEREIEGIAIYQGGPADLGESSVKASVLGYTQEVGDLERFHAAAEQRLAVEVQRQERGR